MTEHYTIKEWRCQKCNGILVKVSPICVGAQQQPRPDSPLIPVHRWLCQCKNCKAVVVRDP